MSRTRHHSRPFRDFSSSSFGLHNWARNEPKIWRKLQKHRKRRAATRRALQKAMEDPEGAIFPVDKRPWIYFH